VPKVTVAAQLAAIKKQKAALEKKEAALRNRGQQKVLKQIVRMARSAGLTAADLAAALGGKKSGTLPKAKGRRGKSKLAGRKVAPKYRNPANAKETWAGRGRAPAWAAALKKSGKLETALIAS